MTFQGDKIIGKPTMAMIEIFIAKRGLYCEPQDVFDYWERKDWLTKKKVEVKTLEVAIEVYNSIAVQRARKKNAKEYKRIIKEKKNERRKKAIEKRRKDNEAALIKENPKPLKEIENKAIVLKKDECQKTYDEQLKDKRWYSFRKFIFDVRGKQCEKCGTKKNLQVHHISYRKGCLAWEYTCNDVMVVCDNCHKKIHGIDR